MNVTTRVSNRRNTPKKSVPEPSSHRKADLIGIGLISLGLIGFCSLILSDNGILGSSIGATLRLIFGKGSYVVPIVVAGIGLASITGYRGTGIRHLVWGATIAFVAFVGAAAVPVHGDFFDVSGVSGSGGYLGAVVGWGASALFGASRLVALGAVMCLGAVLCLNVPLRDLFRGLTNRPRRAVINRQPEASHAVVAPRIPPQVMVDEAEKGPAAEKGFGGLTRRPKAPPTVRGNDEPTRGIELASDVSIPKEGYQLPPMALLNEPPKQTQRSKQEMQKNIETLEGTLEQFGIDANVVEVATGPTVTRYEIQLGPGIRVARITALADNIAMDLAASQVRVEAPIPGKAAIGVEVPNAVATPVFLRELAESKEFRENPSRLAVCLGKDVSGVNKYADLTKMPHLLIGGATNSGKSIGLSTIITSLLMRNTPKDLRLVMIDPKRVELTLFDRIPHLMCPVIKDVKETPGVLRAVWREMDRRYDVFSEAGVRNIDGWNAKATFQERMPYIVVIIDELADLMIQAAAEVETSICRLAQLARATGIHLVIATQRPSVDVITGTIKANIASRIAFTVSSQIDSRTILDGKGAEALIGRGDMLFLPIDASKPVRIQGCYVSEAEIDAVCKFWRHQEQPSYTLQPIEDAADPKKESGDFGDSVDPLYADAVRWAVERGQASTSMLQRKFSIGFQRASRLLDNMEERGIVGPRDGPRPREVLMSYAEVDELFGGGGAPAGAAASKDEAWD